MTNVQLGYACINMDLQEQKILVNRSCVAKTFKEKGVEYAIGLARGNLENVLRTLEWNERNDIKLYRMSSDMFPHVTNEQFIADGEDYAYRLTHFDDLLKRIGQYARDHGHRLTFHPGQYNQIGALDRSVYRRTIRELSFHADVLDRMGCDLNSVIIIHGGGTYGDKKATMDRWISQFFQMPNNVRNRIVIENCERQYNYKDVLYIANRINRPVVFDTHHHTCYSQEVEKLPDPETFIHEICETWTRIGLKPKFHISEQAPGKRVGAHSDYIEHIPDYFFELGMDVDIMIEAKCKERAVNRLRAEYLI